MIWIAIGAVLASASWIGAQMLSKPNAELGLVIKDDFPVAFFQTRKNETRQLLARSAHRCQVKEYSTEMPPPDGFGTLYAPIDPNSKSSINCLLAVAKEWQLSVQIAEMKRPVAEKTEKK